MRVHPGRREGGCQGADRYQAQRRQRRRRRSRRHRTLDFVDAQTRQSIYKSKYSGSHSEQKAGGLEATWTMVLNKSLDQLIASIVLDDEPTAALNARLAQQPSIAATE
jgi:hypothetical protein